MQIQRLLTLKKNPDFVQKTIKDILSAPTEIRKTKLSTKEFDEKSLISKELISLAKSDFGVDLQVFSETDSGIYDPKRKGKACKTFQTGNTNRIDMVFILLKLV